MLPPHPHNIILFHLDVKFPLLRFLQFLSDLKSTISCQIKRLNCPLQNISDLKVQLSYLTDPNLDLIKS